MLQDSVTVCYKEARKEKKKTLMRIKVLRLCTLSETRVTGASQRTIVSKMGHSCVQTRRHRGGN